MTMRNMLEAIAAERKRIGTLILEMPFDDWREFLHALDIAANYASHPDADIREASDYLWQVIYGSE